MFRNATPRKHNVVLLLTLLLSFQTGHAQPNIVYTPVITGLNQPIDIVNAGDGTNRLFVVQKEGLIRVFSSTFTPLGNLVTVAGVNSGGERGLLSLAFHPNYETNRFFYVYYSTTTGTSPNTTTFINIARYQTRADNPNLADDTSRKVLLSIAKPVGDNFTNHNGGRLQFGSDGKLYFATGDGGSGGDPFNNAQNGNSLLGKMIRLHVLTGDSAYVAPYYSVPTDNPYTDDAGVRDEIFAMGLRNPFRWGFDRLTYDMWIGDVGQDNREEIDFLAAGIPPSANFGWRCYEGNLPHNTSGCLPQGSYISPVYDYPNPPGAAAVTGGHVYRGTTYPAMYGYYFATDFYSGTLYKILPNGGGWWVTSQPGASGIAAFGEAENGEMFAVSLNAGSISAVTTTTALPLRLISFNALRKNDHIEISWKTAYEYDIKNFQVEYSFDGRTFQPAQSVMASNSMNGSSYSVQHHIAQAGVIYYRLRITNADGSLEFSPIVTTTWDKQTNGVTIPGIVRNNRLLLTIHEPSFTSLRIISNLGQTLFVRNIAGMKGFNEINLPDLPAGTYVVNLVGNQRQHSGRIVISR